jgi:hypothetical protein
MAAFNQRSNKVVANKPGSTGDENPHNSITCRF